MSALVAWSRSFNLGCGPTSAASPLATRLCAFIIVLNALDACLTLVWVKSGIAVEANVLLRDLVDHAPAAFVLSKMAVVCAGVWVLRQHASRPLALGGLVLCFAAYALLTVYHAYIAVFGW